MSIVILKQALKSKFQEDCQTAAWHYHARNARNIPVQFSVLNVRNQYVANRNSLQKTENVKSVPYFIILQKMEKSASINAISMKLFQRLALADARDVTHIQQQVMISLPVKNLFVISHQFSNLMVHAKNVINSKGLILREDIA